MTTLSQNTHTTSIHPDTTVGLLSLTVSDLTRSLTFYTEALGFEVLEQEGTEATLGRQGPRSSSSANSPERLHGRETGRAMRVSTTLPS